MMRWLVGSGLVDGLVAGCFDDLVAGWFGDWRARWLGDWLFAWEAGWLARRLVECLFWLKGGEWWV